MRMSRFAVSVTFVLKFVLPVIWMSWPAPNNDTFPPPTVTLAFRITPLPMVRLPPVPLPLLTAAATVRLPPVAVSVMLPLFVLAPVAPVKTPKAPTEPMVKPLVLFPPVKFSVPFAALFDPANVPTTLFCVSVMLPLLPVLTAPRAVAVMMSPVPWVRAPAASSPAVPPVVTLPESVRLPPVLLTLTLPVEAESLMPVMVRVAVESFSETSPLVVLVELKLLTPLTLASIVPVAELVVRQRR